MMGLRWIAVVLAVVALSGCGPSRSERAEQAARDREAEYRYALEQRQRREAEAQLARAREETRLTAAAERIAREIHRAHPDIPYAEILHAQVERLAHEADEEQEELDHQERLAREDNRRRRQEDEDEFNRSRAASAAARRSEAADAMAFGARVLGAMAQPGGVRAPAFQGPDQAGGFQGNSQYCPGYAQTREGFVQCFRDGGRASQSNADECRRRAADMTSLSPHSTTRPDAGQRGSFEECARVHDAGARASFCAADLIAGGAQINPSVAACRQRHGI